MQTSNAPQATKTYHAQGACCQVEYAGQHFSTAGQLASALAKKNQAHAAPELYPFDHIYSDHSTSSFKAWQAGNASAAVLYGMPGAACFKEVHQVLKDAVAKSTSAGW